MKKKVFLIQIEISKNNRAAYLPYAAGCLMAYALGDAEIATNYDFGNIIFTRNTVEENFSLIEAPDIVAFSCYTWNIEYNRKFALLIKEKYPDCKIVLGGHEVPKGDIMLEKFDFADVLIHNEGEEVFAALLKAYLHKSPLSVIPNLSYRLNGSTVTTPEKTCFDIENYPSPYTMGLFDEVIENNPEVTYNAILETNRGCPYGCSYCDWCFTKKIRYFSLEKVKAEIDWLSKMKIDYCYCADANFGIAERDVEIAAYVIKKRRENGYPKIFKPCYAKNSDDNVFEAGRMLNADGADKGVTLAYQTLNEEALENIGRKNLTLDRFANLDARYNEANIPTYTELILGMPGETYESFCKGMCYLLEKGQHNSMTVYNCQVYANSPMGDPEYRKKFGIKTARIPVHGIHYPVNYGGVQEYYDVIYETDSMPKADWVKANLFSIILQAFHHLGMLRCFAIYLRNEKNISYYDFYNKLLDYIFSGASKLLYEIFDDIRKRTDDTDTGDWTYQKDMFSKVGWYFEEGAFLEMIYAEDKFREEIRPFLESFGLEKELFEALFNYQMDIIRRPGINEATVESEYDFYSYFRRIYEDKYACLEKKAIRLDIKTEKQISDWAQYAIEIIWFGKRRSATLITNPRETIDFKYV